MEDSEKALADLEREIAARLKPVCSHMPEAEFDAMVRDIARVKLKYQQEENGTSLGGNVP